MKRIYTFTLDDSECVSSEVFNVIRVMAYLIYTKLRELDYQSQNPILCNSSLLEYNELYERCIGSDKFSYSLLSDKENKDKVLYDPVIINNNTFGITVNEGIVNDGDLAIILDDCLKFMHYNYKFNMNSIVYNSIMGNEYKARLDAINKFNQSEEKVISQVVKRNLKFKFPFRKALGR